MRLGVFFFFLTLRAVGDDVGANPDQYLPRAHTCFFSVNLPKYSSKELMTEKLKYAIFNCTEMDADFRLTDTDVVGWTDALPGAAVTNTPFISEE